jgi:hypothetical protein
MHTWAQELCVYVPKLPESHLLGNAVTIRLLGRRAMETHRKSYASHFAIPTGFVTMIAAVHAPSNGLTPAWLYLSCGPAHYHSL